MTQIFNFRGHISHFRAKNTAKSGHSKAENNAQTIPEQLQKNFLKVQKMDFLTLKMVKMALSEGQNLTLNFNFRGHISTFRAKNTTKSGPFKAENNA